MGKTQLTSMNYLNIISYRRLFNWSAAHLLGNDLCFTKRYPLVRIGALLKPNRNIIKVEDNEEYKQVRLKTNGGGADLRGVKVGKDIGTKKQYQISTGQFIMSKIDARNGAFGIVDNSLNGAIVTGDFPVFDVDKEKLNPAYLQLLSSTKQFIKFAQSCSRGTTNRQRIDVKQFLNLEIPLPSLEEQNAIVAAYNDSYDLAEQYEEQAKQEHKGIAIYLIDKLGIPQIEIEKKEQKKNYLEFYDYSDISQWGVDFIRKTNIGHTSSIYPCCRVVDVCNISSGGTPSRGQKEYYNGDILWVKTGELKNDVIYDTEEKITQLGLVNSSAKLYPTGSLIIAMYGATIGQTAKLGVEATTNQACAVLFDIDNTAINTDYLWLYLQSQTEKLKSMAYGGAQPNINAGIVANYLIPLPPMDVQNEIVAHISEVKEQIKSLRALAVTTRNEAKQQFEQTIFE